MAKEGEEGRKKLNKITHWTTLGLALIQALGLYFTLKSQGGITYTTGFAGWFTAIIIMLMFTAGASLIVWLGEQINIKGIGNGISIILFAGIISRGPAAVMFIVSLIQTAISDPTTYAINYLWARSSSLSLFLSLRLLYG